MKKITLKFLSNIDKEHVRESQLTVFDRIVFRPIGVYLAYLAIRLFSLNSNNVTFISVLLTIIGCLLILCDYLMTGALVIALFPILDCVDGTMARSGYKGRLNGTLADALGGYSFIVIFWSTLIVKFFVEGSSVLFSLSLFILNANLWSRLFYLKSIVVQQPTITTNSEETKVRSSYLYYLYENLEFGSALAPIFILCIYFNFLDIFIYLYAFVSALLFCWVLHKIFLGDK